MSEQNNQGFRGIPGVPDGWELVAIRVPKEGEWFVGVDGKPFQADHAFGQQWTIIRKIEVPKRYRAFANGAEFKPHRDRWVTDSSGDCYKIIHFTLEDLYIGIDDEELYSWDEAFTFIRFDDDGTPFGVEVTQ